jgi:glycosyltransferase involved in cell wall biosynthesis
LKILHVITAPRAEGTPRLVLDWLTQEEYAQEILFLKADGELRKEFESHSVWQYYNDKFRLSFRNAIKVVKLVRSICKHRRPDIVMAWPFGFSHWIAIGARLAGVKFNLAYAGNPAGEDIMRKYVHPLIIASLGLLAGNKVVACSQYVQRSYTSLPFISRNQFTYVYNCTQLEKYLPTTIADRQQGAVMVATLEAHKDHKTLLEAWRIIEGKGFKVPLKIAGDGSLRNYLKDYRVNLDLKQVDFLGSRNDVPALLHSSRI